MNRYQSWGNYPTTTHQKIAHFEWRNDHLPQVGGSVLPYGQGRSYGDSCLNEGNTLIVTDSLKHIISFQPDTGVIRCEAGLTIDELLNFCAPKGYFVPVTPGTKFISLGGAVANDVHGKNHHVAGSFGCHVLALELLRSNGQRLLCSATENSDLFYATIGGLGLTGLITWVELKLKRIQSAYIDQTQTRFNNIYNFFELSERSDGAEYTVAWVDCLGRGRRLGRGIFIQGNESTRAELKTHGEPKLSLPVFAPSGLLNSVTIKTFNELYYRRPFKKTATVHYNPFFYPLDGINHWNRLYGPRGFLQYQCVVPLTVGESTMVKLLEKISEKKIGSFLAVLKIFGNAPSVGLMSFARPGVTLALDFANTGSELFALLNELDQIVIESGGAIYAAKDARMSKMTFRASYPQIDKFKSFIDPHFSSSFWRRVTS